MKKITDLETIKKIACELLKAPIIKTDYSPMVVMHPFTNSGFVGYRDALGEKMIGDITQDNEARSLWIDGLMQVINDCSTVYDVRSLVNKPYRLMFVDEISEFLSPKDYAILLVFAYVGTENPIDDANMNKRKLVSMFKKADKQFLMDKEDYKIYSKLDDVVTIYRGVTEENKNNIKALSWTLNYNTAKWFAERYGSERYIYKAQIDKNHIFAVNNRREEFEVIVDPKFLTQIELVERYDKEEFEKGE